MRQFQLGYEHKQIMQISNDAFFYLLQEEEPLDEANLEEALEILALFPHGFQIEETWKAVEESDLIECVFIPYEERPLDFDESLALTTHIQQQLKWLDPNTARVWWLNLKTGARTLRGDFKVRLDKFGQRYFHTGDQARDFIAGKSSLYYLKHFKKAVPK